MGFAMIDFMSIVPFYIEVALGADDSSFMFLRIARFLRIMRLLRVLRSYRVMTLANSELQRGLIMLVLSILSLIFISTGCILEAESYGADDPVWNFHNTVYFVVVTLSTVGYGDMSPITT